MQVAIWHYYYYLPNMHNWHWVKLLNEWKNVGRARPEHMHPHHDATYAAPRILTVSTKTFWKTSTHSASGAPRLESSGSLPTAFKFNSPVKVSPCAHVIFKTYQNVAFKVLRKHASYRTHMSFSHVFWFSISTSMYKRITWQMQCQTCWMEVPRLNPISYTIYVC